MKKTIITIISVTVLASILIGYSVVKRNNLLNSGENILLVDRFKDIYVTTKTFPESSITWRLKVVGVLDQLSEEKIDKHIKGKTMVFLDPEVLAYFNAESPQISQDFLNDLQVALTVVSPDQLSLCKGIEDTTISNNCLMDHYIIALSQTNRDSAICKQIFVDKLEQQCLQFFTDNSIFVDADSNNLLDNYEIIAVPEVLERKSQESDK